MIDELGAGEHTIGTWSREESHASRHGSEGGLPAVLVVALCEGEYITGARLTVPGPEDDGSTDPPL